MLDLSFPFLQNGPILCWCRCIGKHNRNQVYENAILRETLPTLTDKCQQIEKQPKTKKRTRRKKWERNESRTYTLSYILTGYKVVNAIKSRKLNRMLETIMQFQCWCYAICFSGPSWYLRTVILHSNTKHRNANTQYPAMVHDICSMCIVKSAEKLWNISFTKHSFCFSWLFLRAWIPCLRILLELCGFHHVICAF